MMGGPTGVKRVKSGCVTCRQALIYTFDDCVIANCVAESGESNVTKRSQNVNDASQLGANAMVTVHCLFQDETCRLPASQHQDNLAHSADLTERMGCCPGWSLIRRSATYLKSDTSNSSAKERFPVRTALWIVGSGIALYCKHAIQSPR